MISLRELASLYGGGGAVLLLGTLDALLGTLDALLLLGATLLDPPPQLFV